MYLPSGTVLHNRYEVQGVLGHGGFGVTYLALDRILHVQVAVKEYLPRQMATRAEGATTISIYTGEAREHFYYGLEKFLEEARAVAQFGDHPNIVSARDYFQENGTAYMVMPYIEGVDFKEYLEQQGGRIPFDLALQIMLPVMDALQTVHEVSLLHRDVSPDNIYLTGGGQVKVMDFGAARYFAGEHSKSLSVILKTGYAPPEQYRAKGKQGPWTDVYATAATLYRAVTGQAPLEALERLAEDELAPPSRLGVAIPSSAEDALLKALAVDPKRRFQSMREFQQALLGQEVEQLQPPFPPASFPSPPAISQVPEPASPAAFVPASDPGPTPAPQPLTMPSKKAQWQVLVMVAGMVLAGVIILLGVIRWLQPLAFGPTAPKTAQYTPLEDALIRSYDLMQEKRMADAKTILNKALEQYPGNPLALNNLAAIMVHEKEFDKADTYLGQALLQVSGYKVAISHLLDVGGICQAFRPEPKGTAYQDLGALIQKNIQSVKQKMAATPLPKPESRPTPPPPFFPEPQIKPPPPKPPVTKPPTPPKPLVTKPDPPTKPAPPPSSPRPSIKPTPPPSSPVDPNAPRPAPKPPPPPKPTPAQPRQVTPKFKPQPQPKQVTPPIKPPTPPPKPAPPPPKPPPTLKPLPPSSAPPAKPPFVVPPKRVKPNFKPPLKSKETPTSSLPPDSNAPRPAPKPAPPPRQKEKTQNPYGTPQWDKLN